MLSETGTWIIPISLCAKYERSEENFGYLSRVLQNRYYYFEVFFTCIELCRKCDAGYVNITISGPYGYCLHSFDRYLALVTKLRKLY